MVMLSGAGSCRTPPPAWWSRKARASFSPLKATQMALDVPMMGTLTALAGCASQPGVFLTSWRISKRSAVVLWM